MKASYFILVVFLKLCFLFSSDGYILSSFHLVDGNSPNEGRVEVTLRDDDGYNLTGIVVSDDKWTRDAAKWVCEELGYLNAAFVPDDNRFGRGLQSGIFSIDKIFSIDNRTLVEPECNSNKSDNCSEIGAAGVICQKPGYLGCYQIRPVVFSQINITETSEVGNNDKCLEFCRNKEDITIIEFLFGRNLPALYTAQSGDTCYCLNNISESFQKRVCNTRCSGDPEQFCGRKQPDSYIVFNASTGYCPEISGVNLNVSGRNRFGDIVRANCSGGSQLMGDDELQCLGGPDFFEWNGTVPTCRDQETTTNEPSTERTRMTITPATRKVTRSDEQDSDDKNMDMNMNSSGGSQSASVPIGASAGSAGIVAVSAASIAAYINKKRKAGSKSKSVPNNEEPSENSVTEVTEPADDVRKDPKQSELDQSSPNDTPHSGLIENDYKVFDDSSHDNPAFDDDILQFTTITIYHEIIPYPFPIGHEHSGEHQEAGEMIDNVLYEPADNQTIQTGFAIQNCSDITQDSVDIHYSDVEL
ncbi:uncharacterized protein LOC754555 [Strongylocentrotus purpuratus]|uniref:Uncharacterized protein n=1 Tax=Strongylocentrotus purpuratus TaxID=7668 RepID=A0A7M7G9M2_STRPU|nr:uncharacterized protein LOC754555 [Strongylocentrotus purpuratus]